MGSRRVRGSADTLDGAFVTEVDQKPALSLIGNSRLKMVPFARSVMLSSEELGLIARIDLIESHGDCVVPVDYKGKVPDVGNAWEQIGFSAQGLILRDNGYSCTSVSFSTQAARHALKSSLTKRWWSQRNALSRLKDGREWKHPTTARTSRKCLGCSLARICLQTRSTFFPDLAFLARIGYK